MKDWIRKHKIKLLIILGIVLSTIMFVVGSSILHMDMNNNKNFFIAYFPLLISLYGVFLWARKIKKKKPTISRLTQIITMYFLVVCGVFYILMFFGILPME